MNDFNYNISDKEKLSREFSLNLADKIEKGEIATDEALRKIYDFMKELDKISHSK